AAQTATVRRNWIRRQSSQRLRARVRRTAVVLTREGPNGMTKPPAELLEFLYRYDSPTQSLALGLRKVVLDEMAPCHEYIFEMRSKVVLVYAATERVLADGICAINVYRKHVLLGFFHGAELKDRRGL